MSNDMPTFSGAAADWRDGDYIAAALQGVCALLCWPAVAVMFLLLFPLLLIGMLVAWLASRLTKR